MKANELRIGNWLNGPEGNAQVTGIQNREVVEIGEMGHVMEDVSPIPLTEDWLKKMNFQRVTDVGKGGSNEVLSLDLWLCEGLIHFYSNNEEDYSDVTAWYVDYGEPCENYFCRVQYVHSLQNLYFGLTGEELTIKQ